MATKHSLTLALPRGFRCDDILAIHKRDPQEIAERVIDAYLAKGLLWRGSPAQLSLHFSPTKVRAQLLTDGLRQAGDKPLFAGIVSRMLGLNQQIEAFEKQYAEHPQLGKLIANNAGLRVPLAATPFEALTWAITGQKISLRAAVSLRRKLIQAANLRHSSGLLCYPGAVQISAMADDVLRQAGFSATKASTLQSVSRLVAEDRLPLDAWALNFPGGEVIRDQLLAIRGIGPWTVNYTLLRGYGWLDGSLHGDAAVRRGLQTLLASPEAISESKAEKWLAAFSPWRALIGAHIWAAQSSAAPTTGSRFE